MADITNIAWTDSTFNPWWGCTKVSPGCDHCYAEALDKRTGGNHWGPRTTPRTMSADYWQKPKRWQKEAKATGERRKVFCGSMCDVFDENAPEDERERLWQLIRETPMLDWQLLTKRAKNIIRLLPDDWKNGYQNVWLGVTVENKKHGLMRANILKTIPAKIRFLSIEPLLEDLGLVDFSPFDWVIIGGESGPHARPMKHEWVTNIKHLCDLDKTPFFFKQWGGYRNKSSHIMDSIKVNEWPVTKALDSMKTQ